MIFVRLFGFSLFAIAVATAIWLASCTPGKADGGNLPADVVEWIGRRASCREWSQKTTDLKQANEADKIMRSLRCANINRDERALRTRYANVPRIIAALNGTWIKVIERVPVSAPAGVLPSNSKH